MGLLLFSHPIFLFSRLNFCSLIDRQLVIQPTHPASEMTLQRLLNVRWHIEHPIALRVIFIDPRPAYGGTASRFAWCSVAPVMAAYASQVLALYRGGQVRTAFYHYVEGGALAFWAWLLCLRRD